MLSSLLPGIRELRAPLAAGYLWFAFGFLVAGSPTDLKDAPAAIQDLAELTESLGAAASGIALSFFAYLLGSLSQDVFGRFLPVGIEALSWRFSTADRLSARVRGLVKQLMNSVQEVLRAPEDTDDPGARVERALPALKSAAELSSLFGEMEAQGASEGDKPEARRPMVEAEETLRIAVVPPLLALAIYFTVTDSIAWLFGVLFAIALYLQAAAQRVEAQRLVLQYERSTGLRDTRAQLRHLERVLATGSKVEIDTAFGDIDWRELNRRFR